MPSFPDSAVLILLVLLLFGPKKLPELARQFGKLMADFRRASNEFRTQMEDELRLSEQADRQKQIAAVEAAAPTPSKPPPIPLKPSKPSPCTRTRASLHSIPRSIPRPNIRSIHVIPRKNPHTIPCSNRPRSNSRFHDRPEPAASPLPIAISGEPSILPPSTGLPVANSAQLPFPEDLPAESPAQADAAHDAAIETEALHG